jgi:hypothetical protein
LKRATPGTIRKTNALDIIIQAISEPYREVRKALSFAQPGRTYIIIEVWILFEVSVRDCDIDIP